MPGTTVRPHRFGQDANAKPLPRVGYLEIGRPKARILAHNQNHAGLPPGMSPQSKTASVCGGELGPSLFRKPRYLSRNQPSCVGLKPGSGAELRRVMG